MSDVNGVGDGWHDFEFETGEVMHTRALAVRDQLAAAFKEWCATEKIDVQQREVRVVLRAILNIVAGCILHEVGQIRIPSAPERGVLDAMMPAVAAAVSGILGPEDAKVIDMFPLACEVPLRTWLAGLSSEELLRQLPPEERE
jgi:hypothetical protein